MGKSEEDGTNAEDAVWSSTAALEDSATGLFLPHSCSDKRSLPGTTARWPGASKVEGREGGKAEVQETAQPHSKGKNSARRE